jgi:hypothetical protein
VAHPAGSTGAAEIGLMPSEGRAEPAELCRHEIDQARPGVS